MSTSSAPAAVPPSPAAQRVSTVERQVQQLQQSQATFATNTNRELQEAAVRIRDLEAALRQREEEVKAIFDQAAAQRGAEMAALVADAKAEFDRQRSDMQTIASAVEAEFEKVKAQLEQGSSKDS